MIENANLDAALRNVFKSSPFSKMISDDLESLCGNCNGTTFAEDQSGKKVCLDDSGKLLEEGVILLQSVMGKLSPKNSLLEIDVEVSGTGYCLTLFGPPTTEVPSWTVARRENIAPQRHCDIASRVNL